MNVDELAWKRVDDGFSDIEGGIDEGWFYGLEELDDVSVVKDKNTIKFVPKAEVAKQPKGESAPNASEPQKSKKQKAKKPLAAAGEAAKKQKKASIADPSADALVDEENEFSALSHVDEEPVNSLGQWPQGLDSRLYTGLKKLEFSSPTTIQAQSIPAIISGKDVIGKAATGSGKTLAYGLPLLQAFYSNPEAVKDRPVALIVSPTRELAHQIRDHLQAVLPPKDKNAVVALTGGLAIQKQLRLLNASPAVVVATPGRLLAIIEQMPVKQQEAWQQIPSLVLDEADRLVQSGSFTELESVLKILGVVKERQVLVFSATFQTDLWRSLAATKKRKHGDDIRDIMQQKFGLSRTAEFVDADPESQVAESVLQAVIECPNMEKDLYLYYFVTLYPGKTAVFVNSIDAVKRIVPLLKELGVTAFGVHSDMIQKQRLRSIERFRNTDKSILIATDVAARGLDVPSVDHVVHYHLPRSADMYIHRSGRTARAGNQGVSVVLVSPQEASGPLPNLLKLIGTKPSHLAVDYDILERLRARTTLAKKIADTQTNSAKQGKSDAWLSEAADELGIELDDDMTASISGDPSKKKRKTVNEAPGALRAMRAELADLLQQRLMASRRYLTAGTTNLAHEMLSQPASAIPGRPMKTAIEELSRKKRKQSVPPASNVTAGAGTSSATGVSNASTASRKAAKAAEKSASTDSATAAQAQQPKAAKPKKRRHFYNTKRVKTA